MSQNILQAFPTEEAGTFVDGHAYNPVPEKAIVLSTSVNTLEVGQPVIIANPTVKSQGTVVDAALNATDKIYGFIMYNQIKNTYIAGDVIPMISMPDSKIKLIAGNVINAGDKLEYDPTSKKVIPYAGGSNTIIGIAITKAVANEIVYVKQTAFFATV